MKKLIFIFLFYFLLIYNSSLSSNDNLNNLKIGLLAPFSGDYENLGNSLLLSTQLALSEIGDNRIVIIPKDTGSDNKEKFENALKEIIDRGAKIMHQIDHETLPVMNIVF